MQDELVPDNEDEDISYRTRAKSGVIIGDVMEESIVGGNKWAPRGKRRKRAALAWSRTEDAAAREPSSQEGDGQSDSVDDVVGAAARLRLSSWRCGTWKALRSLPDHRTASYDHSLAAAAIDSYDRHDGAVA